MPKKSSTNLGKALMKKKKQKFNMENAKFYHEEQVDENLKYKNIKSTLELDNITDLLQTAQIEDRNFEA